VSSRLNSRPSRRPTSSASLQPTRRWCARITVLTATDRSPKKELAREFGLGVWKVDFGLKRAVAMLLAPETAGALDAEALRQQKRDRIAQRRRERGRPLASEVHDLATEAFDKLGALERDLGQRCYGIGEERPWTRRELAVKGQ
jgi:hypothetical protein